MRGRTSTAKDETLPRVAAGCGSANQSFQTPGRGVVFHRIGLSLIPGGVVSTESNLLSDTTRLQAVAVPAILWHNTAQRRALRIRPTSLDTGTSSATRHEAGSCYRKEAGA